MNQEQPIGSDQQGLVSARRRSAARWELKSRVALTGVEFRRRAGPWPQEGLPVREEIVEDDAGVVSSVVVPDLAPTAEDAMEEESSAGSLDV